MIWISICFDFEWKLWFLLRCMTLWLTHWTIYSCWVWHSSFKNYFIHNISLLASVSDMYSVSIVKCDILLQLRLPRYSSCYKNNRYPNVSYQCLWSNQHHYAHKVMWSCTKTQIGLHSPSEIPHDPLYSSPVLFSEISKKSTLNTNCMCNNGPRAYHGVHQISYGWSIWNCLHRLLLFSWGTLSRIQSEMIRKRRTNWLGLMHTEYFQYLLNIALL